MLVGALFQILVASPMNVFRFSINFSFAIPLVIAHFLSLEIFLMSSGFESKFDAFHISVNFACAFIWLIDSIFCFASIDSMLTLSFVFNLIFSPINI